MMSNILSLKDALGPHVYSKISELTSTNVAKVTGMILECDKQTILEMLGNNKILTLYVTAASNSLAGIRNDVKSENLEEKKDKPADELYNKISLIVHCELMAAKITGMLLDLDPASIDNILSSEKELKKAVEKATVVLVENESMDISPQEEIADMIYSQVEEKYPNLAPQITGMLLELDKEKLKELMKTCHELDKYIEEAYQVLLKLDS